MPIIDEEFLSKLVREPIVADVSQEQEDAFSKIARLVSVRERCSCELVARLMRDGLSEDIARDAVSRALSCGLVDDLRYGVTLVRSRISQGKGRAGIEEELASCGISACDLEGWPDEFFPSDGPTEEQRAFDVLLRKPPRSKNVYASACRKLASRGFSRDVVFSVARRYAEHCDGVF